jgi:hypothetical protein
MAINATAMPTEAYVANRIRRPAPSLMVGA